MLRLATPGDIPRIVRLMQSEPGFWNATWDESVLRQALATADGLAFVWIEVDQVLGFACAHDLGFRGYLSELIVASQLRGQGVGRRLLEAVEAELIKRGRAVLIADVWHGAAAFYRSLGWETPDVELLRKRLR